MIRKDKRQKIDDEALTKLMIWRPKLSEVAAFFDMSTEGVEKHIRKHHNLTFIEFRAKHMIPIKVALINKMLRMALDKGGNLEAAKYLMNNLSDWCSTGNAYKDDDSDSLENISGLKFVSD